MSVRYIVENPDKDKPLDLYRTIRSAVKAAGYDSGRVQAVNADGTVRNLDAIESEEASGIELFHKYF